MDLRAGFPAGRRRRPRSPSSGSPMSGGRVLPPGAARPPRPSRLRCARAPRLSSSFGPGLSESRNEYTPPKPAVTPGGSPGVTAGRTFESRPSRVYRQPRCSRTWRRSFPAPKARRSRTRRYRGRGRLNDGVGRRSLGVAAFVIPMKADVFSRPRAYEDRNEPKGDRSDKRVRPAGTGDAQESAEPRSDWWRRLGAHGDAASRKEGR